LQLKKKSIRIVCKNFLNPCYYDMQQCNHQGDCGRQREEE
jgi:hypothetical protein